MWGVSEWYNQTVSSRKKKAHLKLLSRVQHENKEDKPPKLCCMQQGCVVKDGLLNQSSENQGYLQQNLQTVNNLYTMQKMERTSSEGKGYSLMQFFLRWDRRQGAWAVMTH